MPSNSIKRFLLTFCVVMLMISAFPQTDNFYPFVMDWTRPADSPASIAFLLDPPAGKYGFIESRNGHTVYPGGTRFRMWGVNFGLDIIFPPKASAPMIADHLARIGINCVRIHFADCTNRKESKSLIDVSRNDTRHIDPETLDRFDYLFSELKKRGIYIYFEVTGGRAYKENDGVKDHDILVAFSPVIYFDPRIRELQKEYMKQVFTHRNPYTGLEYRNDPALVIIELVNETSLVTSWFMGHLYGKNAQKNLTAEVWGDIPVSYGNDLTGLFNTWLKKTVTPGEYKNLLDSAGVPEGSLLPRLNREDLKTAPKNRLYLETRFYMDTERDYFLEMQRFLRDDIGVKCLISGTNDHAHGFTGYPQVSSSSLLDVVDGHVYWNHPQNYKDPVSGKNVQRVMNKPMVSDPLNSTIVQLSRSAVTGKPYTVSEINHPFPNEHASEGIPVMAAYAALNDWDGVFWFTLGHADPLSRLPETLNAFDISHNTRAMSQLTSGALLFLRNDIQPARETITRTYSIQEVYESTRLPGNEKPYFTPSFPLSIPLKHTTRISSFTGPPLKYPGESIASPIISDTKELLWFYGKEKDGVVVINSKCSQGIAGFFGKEGKGTDNMSLQMKTPFGAIILSSLDNKPIPESGKLLLTAGGKVANTGMKWNNDRTWLVSNGTAPVSIEPLNGIIELHNLKEAGSVTVKALDSMGYPLDDRIEVINMKNGTLQFLTGKVPTVWYIIDIKR